MECLWDSITELWLADWAASKAVYAEMHPAFHARARLLKSSVSALSLGRRELCGDVRSELWADFNLRNAPLRSNKAEEKSGMTTRLKFILIGYMKICNVGIMYIRAVNLGEVRSVLKEMKFSVFE